MTKENFINLMNIFKAYQEYEDNLNNLGINIWERDEIGNLTSGYLDMLCELCKDEYPEDDPYKLTNIHYFIYELEWGEKWKPGMITGENEQDIPMGNLEDLWNELIKNHPEIEKE